ncbi:MAG: FAD-dependent oxidoreductase [Metamycoplasmataceae bacterium]
MKKIGKKNKKIEEKEKIVSYNTIVIGAGLTGLTIAKKLSLNNSDVLLIDRHEPGVKSSLNIKIFSQMAKEAKKMSSDPNSFFSSLPIRINSMNKKLNEDNNLFTLKKEGINFIQGNPEIIDEQHLILNGKEIWFKNLVFATGSYSDESKYQNIPSNFFLNSDEINKINQKYESIAIYGTNAVSLELAQAFSNLGTKVYLVDKNVNPFNDFDDEIEAVLKKEYTKKTNNNIEWCLEFEPKEYLVVSDNSIRITLKNDREEKNIEVNKIFLTENRVPNTKSINFKKPFFLNDKNAFIIDANFRLKGYSNFYAIGDVNGIHMLPNQGYYHANLLAESLLRKIKSKIDLYNYSWSIDVDPAISFFGMSKKQIEYAKIPFYEFIYDFKGNYKSNFNDDLGRFKIFTNHKHEILGVILIGNELGDFVPLFSLMQQTKTKFHKLINFNVPFFTKSEALRSAAEIYQKEFVVLKSKKNKN